MGSTGTSASALVLGLLERLRRQHTSFGRMFGKVGNEVDLTLASYAVGKGKEHVSMAW